MKVGIVSKFHGKLGSRSAELIMLRDRWKGEARFQAAEVLWSIEGSWWAFGVVRIKEARMAGCLGGRARLRMLSERGRWAFRTFKCHFSILEYVVAYHRAFPGL